MEKAALQLVWTVTTQWCPHAPCPPLEHLEVQQGSPGRWLSSPPNWRPRQDGRAVGSPFQAHLLLETDS